MFLMHINEIQFQKDIHLIGVNIYLKLLNFQNHKHQHIKLKISLKK